MRLQLLSDLHLETERFDPEPAPGAEALVLAGDIDSTWAAYRRFAGWPVPVIVVAGNHEFDGRDVDDAERDFRALCDELGFTLLERQSTLLRGAGGERIRVLGTTRWSDFDVFGPQRRAKAERAAEYFMRVMGSARHGRPFDAAAVRVESLRCRAWLETELARRPPLAGGDQAWDRTLVITHFAPSLRSADPRYGVQQNGTASFCNADDDLIPRAQVWLHGHLHCRHDYRVGLARVVCNARGLDDKEEPLGYDPLFTLDV